MNAENKTHHEKTKVILNWITERRAAQSAPSNEREAGASEIIDQLFAMARQQEHDAYLATLESPDADEFDS